MNELINFMQQLLNFFLNMLWIVLVIVAIWCAIWIGAFFPIVKNRKHQQKVREFEKDYNKIEVEYGATMRLKEATDEKLRSTLFVLAKKEKELADITAELEKKTTETSKKKPSKK